MRSGCPATCVTRSSDYPETQFSTRLCIAFDQGDDQPNILARSKQGVDIEYRMRDFQAIAKTTCRKRLQRHCTADKLARVTVNLTLVTCHE